MVSKKGEGQLKECDLDVSTTQCADANFTVVLNQWVVSNDLDSANQLRSMVYYHLKGIVKKQIDSAARTQRSQHIVDKLPNTTSLLHDVIIKLSAPDEIFDNREQFYTSIALFVRWMLQDELKKRLAKKRNDEFISPALFTDLSTDSFLYVNFDNALSALERANARCYKIALLHYYLGQNVEEIQTQLSLSGSTVYSELSAAKAFLRVQCDAA